MALNVNTETYFRTLILESPMATAVYRGADMMIELANKAMLNLWGKQETVIGQTLRQALPELDGQPFHDILTEVYITGKIYHTEEQRADLVVDGELQSFFFNFTYKPLLGDDGVVYGILNTATDITSQVEAKRLLTESQERTDFVLNSAGIGSWMVDLTDSTVHWDKRCHELFDIPAGKLTTFDDTVKYIHPEDQNRVTDAVKRAISSGSTGKFDVEYKSIGATDHKVRWIRSKGRAYFDSSGVAYKFAGTAVDFTESIRLKEERQRSDLKAGIALHAAGMGFWSVYILENRVEFDSTCQQMYGLSQPFVSFTDLLSRINPDDLLPIQQALHRTTDQDDASQTRIIEYRYTRPSDHQTRWIRLYGRATFDKAGVAYYFTGTAADVTEEKRMHEALKNVETRYQTAFDNAGLGVVMVRLDGSFLQVNKAFCTLTGYCDDELYQVKYSDITHPDDLSLNQTEVAKLINGTATTTNLHKRYIRKNGTPVWVHINSTRIYDTDGPGIIFKIVQDITAEVIAREEQQKLLGMVENSADFMAVSDLEGHVLYMNEAGKKLLGVSPQQNVTQLHVSQFYATGEHEKLRRVAWPLILKNGRWSGKVHFKQLTTGDDIPCDASGLRIDDPVSGQPIGRGFTMRDLRPWIAAQSALAEHETLLKNITAASPTALWMSDEEGNITYVNQTWLTWTGKTLKESLNYGWTGAIIPEDRQQAIDAFISCLQQRIYYQIQFRIERQDGKLQWCMASGNPQYRANGTFAGYIGSCSDITESKDFERQKDDFLGMASHELKTPVTSIKAYTQMLEATFRREGDIKKADMLHKMGNQVTRLTNLIGDLLDVTKINSGRLQFNQSVFNFNDMVKETVEEVQRTAGKHLLIESYEPTGDVFADRDRIGQVVINLLTNAIKYSPNASRVVISTKSEQTHVTLCVQDFGIGIPADKQQRVFEQFYRVSGNKEHTFPGLGLGLYISSEIIRREGGIISVESVENQGSTFCMKLPAANS